MSQVGTKVFENLLGLEPHPSWKVQRFPFTDAGTETIAKMQNGYLVKFNATHDGVLPALPADDAVLAGVIVGLPQDVETGTPTTVAVALQGSFNVNAVHYADFWDTPGSATPSAAGLARLHEIGIFLDPAVPAGSFAP